MTYQKVAIIGHKGKTGSRVLTQLNEIGIETVGLSRSTTPSFDWENSDNWAEALQGVDAAYVTYQPDLAVPKAEGDIIKLMEVAKTAGVKHIVLLSGRGEEGAQKAEKILIDSGLTWNVVRASWFNQNFSEGFMVEGIMAGNLALPADQILEPFVDADDIADVAFACLTKPELNNKLFEVTGPRAITFHECVATISEALGRPVEYTPITVDAFIDFLKGMDMPEGMLWLMRELFENVLDGRNTNTTNGVEEALGRPATDFKDYVTKTVASGAWSAPAN